MKCLFDSKGYHIANFVNNQLHATTGENVGHYLENYKVFIDMQGRYLGEIVYENRLMYNVNSPYQNMNFGVFGDYGNIGNYGNPGNCGTTGTVSGYVDIPIEKLS